MYDPANMSGLDVMRIAEERGFKVVLDPGPPPQPILRGDREKLTPALFEALKAFREEIIAELLAS